ncbi:hypothetical protein CcI49_30120 [Frankia sp. CcI49]|nr:hypothetical protein CcI49_30120 [Frankia sp. CcI49]
MDGAGDIPAVRELVIDVLSEFDCVVVTDRPQGGDDVLITGKLKSGCQMDRLVGKLASGAGGFTGRQKGQFGIVKLETSDVEYSEWLVMQQQPTVRGVVDFSGAMACEVCPSGLR